MVISDGVIQMKRKGEKEVTEEIADFIEFGMLGAKAADSQEKAYKKGLNTAYNILARGYTASEIMSGIERYLAKGRKA